MTASETDRRALVVGPRAYHDDLRAALPGWRVRTAVAPPTDLPDVGAAVCVHDPPDADAPSVTETLRERDPALPVVVCARTVPGSLVHESTVAGAVATLDSDDLSHLAETVAAAVARAETERERRERAALADAAFEDATPQWVCAGDGRIRRTNRAAAAAVERSPGSLSGAPLWEGPWWTAGDEQELRSVVERAREGGEATVETTAVVEPGRRGTVEVTARSFGRDRLLVTAVDVSERARLAERLRRSEELHRVTLNNMTDTVLLTDGEGRFEYICPNVHFIFGYTVAEIEAMGTIDELLGEGLYDPEELSERGVLTNVECTTTDKAGEEHTLLVNVKEVSIQGGTTLYSCRDVTARKQRERALSALHHTARALLYAETDAEIASLVVDDATDVLAREAVALYRYDAGTNLLRPSATTSAIERRHGPLHPVEPGGGGIGRVFLDGAAAETPLGGEASEGRCLCVPIADHGLLVVASEGTEDLLVEIAELLAATAEAAFDRVDREAALRERDRRLREQNRDLERANRISDLIREVDRALVRAETREEIEQAVCERLVGADRFAFAWIGEGRSGGGTVRPSRWAGTDRGYLDRAVVEADDADEPASLAAETEEPVVVGNVAEDPRAAPWRKDALRSGFQSVVSVPLVAEEVLHGVLTVYGEHPTAFDEVTVTVLAELGETIASAIGAVARKEALVGETVTDLEYAIDEPTGPLARLARRSGATLTLDGAIRQGQGRLAFVTVEGTSPEAVVEAADGSTIVDARVIAEDAMGGVVQLRLSGPLLVGALADHGAVVRTLTVDPDGAELLVSVPPSVAPRTIDSVVTDRQPTSTLLAQRDRRRSERDRRPWLAERLTDRQFEVVRTAYHAGYFESPRRSAGQEVAASLDISPQAFYKHVRAAQRALFEATIGESSSVVE
jgi:HTH-type transcriptional regulator, bacterioopsin transcriptional activator and related proteins